LGQNGAHPHLENVKILLQASAARYAFLYAPPQRYRGITYVVKELRGKSKY